MNSVFVSIVAVNLVPIHNAYSPFDEQDQLLTLLDQQLTTELGSLLGTWSKLTDEQLQQVEGSGEDVSQITDNAINYKEKIRVPENKLPKNNEPHFFQKYLGESINGSKTEIRSGESTEQATLSNIFPTDTTMPSLIYGSTVTSRKTSPFNPSTYSFLGNDTSTKPPFTMDNSTLQALAHHGFVLYIDAITQFCDQRQCSLEDDQCYGLPCSVGHCRC
uniref:Chitin-binding type-1 domain-containing protein n=1 Tax=Heterorhabditis bacteriophora TaxID=37862 RepID=A0A1I7X103_HETBA